MTSETSAPTSQREELRLALVMNGGVSLAVWMGGVSNEIFRLVTQCHPVYAKLLDLTQTTARVDVISGTSAGGVNGAALAVAMVYGGDFSKLRRVWFDTGSFTDLLRSPTSKNPGSLLQGDEFFLKHLQEALASLIPSESPTPKSASQLPIDLRLTTTLLTGVQGGNVDDLGTQLHDVDYRAFFHFLHKPNADTDFRDIATLIPRLARAARSTASFPFAFEPSLVNDENAGTHLRVASDTELKLPRYVVDGGVLDNKPFMGAREAIFGMPTRGSVRRVLAYINPDPGDGPPGEVDADEPPPLATVLVEGILNIPQSQTISDQLLAIDTHNETVRTKKDSVLMLATLDAITLESLAAQLYTVYHRRRLSSTFELFVYQPLSTAARDKPEFARGLRALGKSGRQQMRLAFVEYGGTGWLPGKWPTSMADPIYDRTTWAWGLFPVEFGAKVLLDLLRMTQKLIDVSDPPSPIEPIKRDHTSSRIWTDVDCKRFDDAASSLDPYSDAGKLSRFWTRGYREIDALEKRRALEQANNWRPGTEGLLQTLCRYANHELDLTRWDDELTCNYFPAMFAFLCDPPRTRFCAKRAYGIARIIRRVALFALAKAERALTNADLRVLEKDLAQRLRDLAQRFVVAAQVPDPPRGILRTLMQLEVIEFAFNDHEKLNNDTSIELVQISGNGDSPLGSKSNAKDKLLGLQLAHFGAFYKKSWRANDWLYGRLTGAENLVKVLLNPERLHRRFYTRRADAFTHIRDIALDSVPSTRLHTKLAEIWASEGYAVLINKELEFLDNANYALPDSLPYAARSITTRLHFGILAEELPELLGAIHQDQADGASFSGAGEAMLRDLGDDTRKALDDRLTTSAPDDNRRFNEIQISPEQAQLWLQRGLLAGETLREQAGSDMFTRTLAHTAATLQGTIASKAAHLGPISALFAAIKMPILGFYFVTRGLLGQSRTTAALNGGVLALGLALVLLQFFWTPDDLLVDMIPRSLVVFGWALLAYGSIVCMLRQPWTTILLAVVTLTLLAVYAHSYEHGGVAIAVAGFMLLIAFSVRVPPLQWLVGVVAIVFAAMWGSGWLASGLSAAPPNVDVLVFAAALLIALMLAVLQSSHIPVRIRAFTKRAWSMRSRTRIERFAFGMYLTVQMGYFRRARIASIDVADVRELTPAARRGLMQDDRIVAIDGHATQGMTIADFNRSIEPPHRPRQIRVLRTTSDGDRQQIDVTLP